MVSIEDQMKLFEALRANFTEQELVEIYTYLQPGIDRSGCHRLLVKIEVLFGQDFNRIKKIMEEAKL